jgi:succinate dehydrogenase / fumarate reductase, membrane anchor subunit
MTSASRSIRTPMAKVRGLGAAHSGTEHFWRQRVTAVSNLVLVLALLAVMVATYGRDYAATLAIVAHPAVAIVLILLAISVAVHMRLGMMVIIEDYVHGKGAKLTAVILNTFFSFTVAAVAVFAILRISLRSVL